MRQLLPKKHGQLKLEDKAYKMKEGRLLNSQIDVSRKDAEGNNQTLTVLSFMEKEDDLEQEMEVLQRQEKRFLELEA